MINKILDFRKYKLMHQSLLVVLLKCVGIGLGYLLTIFISKRFGPVGIGIYSLAYTSMIIFGHLASFGLTTSILRYLGEFYKKEDGPKRRRLYIYAFRIISVSSIVLSVVLFLSAEYLATYIFGSPSLTNTFRWVGLMGPFFTLNLINVEYLRGLSKVGASEIFRTIIIPLITLVMIYFLSDYPLEQIPVKSLAIAVFVGALLSMIFIMRGIEKNISESPESFKINDLLNTSSPMMFITLGSYIMGNLSIYVIQIFRDTSEVGIFALSLKLSLFISFILIGVNTVLAPNISRLYWSGELSKLADLIHSHTKLIFWLSLPPFLLLILLPETILEIIGDEFVVGAQVLILLSIGQFFNAFSGPVGLLLNMTGNQNIVLRVTIITLIVTVILNVFLVINYGIKGAAIATALSIAIKNLILVYMAKRRLKINTFYIPFITK